MSLLDGKWYFPKDRNNVVNKDTSNNQRNDNGRFTVTTRGEERSFSAPKKIFSSWSSDTRDYGESNDLFSGSSYMPTEQRQPKKKASDKALENIMKFVDQYVAQAEKQNFKELRNVVIDFFPGAVQEIGSYYNGRNTPELTAAMNKLIGVAATETFAKTLSKVLDSKIWMDDDENTFNEIWRFIGFLLSTTLETSYSSMHQDTITIYISNILPRLWDPEIREMVKSVGITKDLALDLSIAIPLIGTDWDIANIKALYTRFLDKMLIHADDNADILNWETQGILFERVFGKGSNALKVIGQYLVMESKDENAMQSDVQRAVYKEFIKMLYSKLDGYDINDIAYVFKFVAKFRKEHPGAKVLFDSVEAIKYENVRKGLLKAMDDKEATPYLA